VARLDPREQMVHVESWKGRDVHSSETGHIMDTLSAWAVQCSRMETLLANEISRAERQLADIAHAERKVEDEMAAVRKTVQMASTDPDSEGVGGSGHRPVSSKDPKRIKSSAFRVNRRFMNN
jgi:hypothetical protein